MLQTKSTLYTLLALLVATTSLSSPVAADHGPDLRDIEMELIEPCDKLKVCDYIPDAQCNIRDYWTCVALLASLANQAVGIIDQLNGLDQDGDRIPDLVEAEVCGRAVVRDQLDDVPLGQGGSCYSNSNYRGSPRSIYLFVPNGYSYGPDNDVDGIMSHMVLTGHYMIIDADGGAPLYSYESQAWQTVDTDDNDHNAPVPNDDIEDASTEVKVLAAYIVSEAESWAAHAVDLASMVGALIVATVADSAAYAVGTIDTEAGNAWTLAMDTWQPIYDDAEATAEWAEQQAWTTINWAIAFALATANDTRDMVDEDHDEFPDALEPTMCYIENSNSDLDGTCYYGDYRPPYSI